MGREYLELVSIVANQFAKVEGHRQGLVAGESLRAAQKMGLATKAGGGPDFVAERKQLLANKPGRQFTAQEGVYCDPARPWLFRKFDGQVIADEPLRNFHESSPLLDKLIKLKFQADILRGLVNARRFGR